MLQVGKLAAHALGHRRIVKPPIHLGDDENLGFAKIQDVEQLPFPQDRHDGVHDGADLAAGECRNDKFPPIRQLNRDYVTWAKPEFTQ